MQPHFEESMQIHTTVLLLSIPSYGGSVRGSQGVFYAHVIPV